MSTQDISQFLIIAVLAGLFWLQTGEEYTLIGWVAGCVGAWVRGWLGAWVAGGEGARVRTR